MNPFYTACRSRFIGKANQLISSSYEENTLQQNGKWRRLLCLLLFVVTAVCFAPGEAKASWYWDGTDGAYKIVDTNKVTYEVANGRIRISAFENDPGWFDHNTLAATSVQLYYTTDGTNWTLFYKFGCNSDNVEQFNEAVTTDAKNGGRSGHNRVVYLNLNDNLQKITKIRFFVDLDGSGSHQSENNITDDRTITISQMSAFNTVSYEFIGRPNGNTVQANAKISYTKSQLSDLDDISSMWLYSGSNAISKISDKTYDNGFAYAPVSNSEASYLFEEQAYGGRVSKSSSSTIVKAFALPNSAKAVYDSIGQVINFTWLIDAVTTTNLMTQDFKLQVADNPSFTDATETTISYDKTKTFYTYTYSKNLYPNMYFRIARNYDTENWKIWDFGKTDSVKIPFSKLTADSVTAKLQLDNTALIHWHAYPTDWVTGSSFVITKLNNTLNTQSEIKLGKAEFFTMNYIDKQIATCTDYTYTLQIIPPASSSFPTFAPTAAQGNILRSDIGVLKTMVASKGYFPDRTELTWNSDGSFDNFIVKRAEYSSSNYIQIASVTAASTGTYSIDDAKGTPGTYYTYMIVGTINCNNKINYSHDTLYAIGFRSPTGTIYGRVRYENGQAVTGVAVRLESKDAAQLGRSIHLDSTAQSYLAIDSLYTPFGDTATLEAWIKPDEATPQNEVIISRGGQYEIGFDGVGNLYFTAGNKSVTAPYSNVSKEFIHVAAVRSRDSLKILINDVIKGKIIAPFVSTNPSKTVYIGKNGSGNYFKGYIDEVRIWNKPVSDSLIVRDYTRLLTGEEDSLVAYWRFDEVIANQFYDISHSGTKYHQNDGAIYERAVHTDIIPSSAQLSLKAYTDTTGNYFISGVPYTGNGTTYGIIPSLGTHQFDPATVNRLISPSSTSFTVDFTDKSSFPVSGHVYYVNTNVPVMGVQFQIDGRYAQESNGTVIGTGSDGLFTINVPVGIHEVKMVKSNHIFVNGGLITKSDGTNYNYQDASLSTLDLRYDSTTIRFIGRVSGGTIQGGYPLGHSLSKNNLGDSAKIFLTIPSKRALIYPAEEAKDTILHLLPSYETDSSKIHKTVVDYTQNQIIIHPDPATGEFAADLIPEKFILASATVAGWGNVLQSTPPLLDFTNKFTVQKSVYSQTESVYKDPQHQELGLIEKTYFDTVLYNDSFNLVYRIVKPTVTIAQMDDGGKDLPYFGDISYSAISLTYGETNIPLVDITKTGLNQYLFGLPVFNKNVPYNFKIKAFEVYPFYKYVNATTAIIDVDNNGKQVIDNVPTQDGEVTVQNSMQSGSSGVEQLSLNAGGTAVYSFIGGDPNLVNGITDFHASVQFGLASTVPWTWEGSSIDGMQTYLLGGKTSGTDFVTHGPTNMLMVLRDPPGSQSYSYAESGTSLTKTKNYTGAFDQAGDEVFVSKLGAEVVTFSGIGTGVITANKAIEGTGYGIHHEEHYIGSNTKAETNVLTSRFQTSDDRLFVGSPADVFVGYSSNITYGATNSITVIKNSEVKKTDIIYSDITQPYVIVQRKGINFGETFETLFAYPQQHIEYILLPNLLELRNTLLLPKETTAVTAQSKADKDNLPVYVSNLANDDPNFGKSNNDVTAFGSGVLSNPIGSGPSYHIYFPTSNLYRTDTIMGLNQDITTWKQELANNEKAKLNATLLQNYSFHAGNPIEYSSETTKDTTRSNSFNIVVSGSVVGETEVNSIGNGFNLSINESAGTTQGGTFDTTHESTKKLGFVLASDGTDDYFTVDVNTATDDGSYVFRTKGGASACPYEGIDTTKYYQRGTVISQPTVQIEIPKLSVDNPVVSDIPSSRPASYTLTISNESKIYPATFILGYEDVDAIRGATIAIDGTPIGGSGRSVYVLAGQTVTKVLTLTKGPDSLNYDNIPILLHSACQYDPTGYQASIYDKVYISARFIPSCSDIHLAAPVPQWTVNTEPMAKDGNWILPVTIDKFDLNNSLFDHIELQYKESASSQWKILMKFYADSARLRSGTGEKQIIKDPSSIAYSFVMNDGTYNDQGYDIRAVSYCLTGGSNYITTSSDIASGIKDTYAPRQFGSTEPGDGILGLGDNIRVNFNEPIEAGLLTTNSFKVTGIRNGAKGDHSVSVNLDGKNDYLATEFDKNLTGKSITAEAWILPNGSANGTIISQGKKDNSLELALTGDNHIEVIVGKSTIKSDKAVSISGWSHIALVYDNAQSTVSVYYNDQQPIANVSVDKYNGTGHFEFGRSISKAGNLFAGKMHEVRIWSAVRSSGDIQVNWSTMYSGSEPSLMAYYPMNEGKGHIAYDKAFSSNATLTGNWTTPDGRAVALNGNGYVRMNTSLAPVLSDMNYTLELWFKGIPGQTDATLASNGKGDGTDGDSTKNLFFLGFENGLLTYKNDGFTVQADSNYLDNNWHHVAVTVNRTSGTAQLYVDGNMKKSFDAANVGGIQSNYTYLGVRAWHNSDSLSVTNYDRYFNGSVDEFRLWNTYLNQTLISSNNNTRLQGDEFGLMAYYPFETYLSYNGTQELQSTLSDLKVQLPNTPSPAADLVNGTLNDEKAPIKDRGPVSNLRFDWVVNNDAIIINLLEPHQAIDKSVVTIQVKQKGVQDKNGNPNASAITWSAYIDQDQLKWGDAELNFIKDINAPMQFETYIVNKGGTLQHFHFSSLPVWLTANITSGNIDPAGKQKIVFTINQSLNIGTYNEVVYMYNDNNETEALAINVTVRGKQPEWTVNPGDYKYNMSVYGKLRINGEFSINEGDLLAAFVNGKCAGVTHNTHFTANDLWYAFLTVYSDSIKYNNLEFRIWEANTGKTYLATPSLPVTFTNDAVTGTAANPVIFDGKEIIYQNIDITHGWNWISLGITNPNLANITATLANGAWQSGDILKNNELGFDQYSAGSGWVGYLPGFNNISLFMLNAANGQTLSLAGTAVDVKNTAIPLKGGRWNYISYLPQVNMTLKDALAGYEASDEDVIKSQTGFAMYDSRNGWIGNLSYLEPGKGYMLYRKRSADTAFHYPVSALDGFRTGSGTVLNSLQTPVESNFNYAENMTLTAVLGSEYTLQPGDIVIAKVGNEERGRTSMVNNAVINSGTLFFTIAGEQQEPVWFALQRHGKIIAESDAVLSYGSDSKIGTLDVPFVIHLKSTKALITAYPNPFSYNINIAVGLPVEQSSGTHEVQISIHNSVGQLVLSRSKELIYDGHYQTTWNGRKADGSDCAPGVYLILVNIDGTTHNYKVIKQ